MADEKIEDQDPLKNPDEEGEPNKPPEESGSSEDQIAQLKKTNQGLYERMKKAEAGQKKKEEELATLKPPEKKEDKPESKVPEDIEDRVELRLQGYSYEEITFIKSNTEGKSLLEAAKNPFVEQGIKGMRAVKKAEQDTPPPSSKTPKSGEGVEKKKHPSFDEWNSKKRAKSIE